MTLHVRNNQPVQTNGGRIRVTLAGEGTGPAKQYPALRPGALHTLTLGLKSRAFWLGCTYALLVVSGGWLAVTMVILGIADAVFGLRQRYLRGRPPPLPVS